MSQAQVLEDIRDDTTCRCPICLTGYPYSNAYRPHTLGPDCWCLPAPDQPRARTRCWMADFGKIPDGR